MGYKLSKAAKIDLQNIYRQGFIEFGEIHADNYFNKLVDHFELLAKEPYLYPVADEIGPKLRKCVCGVDTIYYEWVDHYALLSAFWDARIT